MEVLVHFVISLIKISILAACYASILLVVLLILGRILPNDLSKQVVQQKGLFWFASGFSISIALFAWMFSYWGDHGLGDGPRIPIGHGLAVNNTNWDSYGYVKEISTSDEIELYTSEFCVQNEIFTGNLDSWFHSYANSHFIYNMEEKTMLEFRSKQEFDQYAARNELPNSTQLGSFSENYHDHWGGWRMWMLP